MANKRVIYTEFEQEFQHTVDHLSGRYGWQPAFILGLDKKWADEKYPEAVFHNSMKLRNAQFDYSRLEKPVPIDARIITDLAEYESRLMTYMQDTTGWNFNVDERRQHYYDLLRFWNTVIHNVKPDLYVPWTTPHVVMDYILYRLCKYYRIPMVFLQGVPLFDNGETQYFHASTSLENQSGVFEKHYTAGALSPLNDDLKKYFSLVRSKKGMPPPYGTDFDNNIGRYWNPDFWTKWVKVCQTTAKLALKGTLSNKIESYAWKCNRHPFDSMKSRCGYLGVVFSQERIRNNDRQLRRIYSEFTVKPDLHKKFVYFAATYQPECGVWSLYHDQHLILDLLSASIPDDWIIYYKEHPFSFQVGGKASLRRDRYYYERISRFKNVRMIPAETDSFELIDKAQVVATPAGTVGWEAMVRGVPAMIFGHVWYQGCKSVFQIETLADCQKAIGAIKSGYKPDQKDLERFAQAIVQVSYKNILYGNFIEEKIKRCSNVPQETERLAELLYETHERNYSP